MKIFSINKITQNEYIKFKWWNWLLKNKDDDVINDIANDINTDNSQESSKSDSNIQQLIQIPKMKTVLIILRMKLIYKIRNN